MDQFSSQLANNLENGYTAGVPEHLIQIYKELSSWCELIQYKIDVDINSQDDIRKQVLSNNLLKHIQGLWQQKVNEFYSVKRDEARDNLSKAFQNRINNNQRISEEIDEDDSQYQNMYEMSTNEEYFNDNDSLSSEEDYYHGIDNMQNKTTVTTSDNNDPSKMVVVVKYNTAPKMDDIIDNYDNFDDEYEFDYGNDNYDYDEYDDYDLHHYKEANVTKISINYTSNEERDAMLNSYRNSNDYVEFYERPATPSLPDWPSCYEEINPEMNDDMNTDDDNSCAADYLNHSAWKSINAYYNAFNKEFDEKKEKQENESNLSYTEQIMKEQMAREEEHGYENENLSYTEQIIKEKKRLSYVSFSSIDLEENNNNNTTTTTNNNNNICSINNYDNYLELEDHDDAINHLTNEFSSLSIKNEDENDYKYKSPPEYEYNKESQNEYELEEDTNSKRRLSIIINESVINGVSMKEISKVEEHTNKETNEEVYKEHLYPRTHRYRDTYYDDYCQESPSAESAISPNEELLLSSTTDEDTYEYSSKKVLMTPISSSTLSYIDTYTSDEEYGNGFKQEPMNKETNVLNDNIIKPPIEGNDDIEKIKEKEENFTKYLLSRRDSGFSESCDEPFIINV